MGWLYCKPTKADLVTYLKGYLKDAHAVSVVGNAIYAVITNDQGKKAIIVMLLSGGRDSKDPNNWGYKPLDETMGPSVVTCPVKLLDMSEIDDTSGWRENCRQYHKQRKVITSLEEGKVYHLIKKRPSWADDSWEPPAITVNGVDQGNLFRREVFHRNPRRALKCWRSVKTGQLMRIDAQWYVITPEGESSVYPQ